MRTLLVKCFTTAACRDEIKMFTGRGDDLGPDFNKSYDEFMITNSF